MPEPGSSGEDQRPGPPDSARLDLPQWLWGGNPEGLVANAQLRSQRSRDGDYSVRTEESYYRRAPRIVLDEQIAGSGLSGPRFDRLPEFARERGHSHSSSIPPEEVSKRREKLGSNPNPVDHLHTIQLALAIAQDEELESLTSIFFDEIRSATTTETGELVFTDPSVHVIRSTNALYHRAKITPMLLRLQHDPQLASGDMTAIGKANKAGELVFSSSEDLFSGFAMLDAYVGPLLGSLTPGVWGFATYRSFGAIVFSFGRPLAGTKGDPAELLQMLSSQSRTTPVEFDPITAGAGPEAIVWWSRRLNSLLGMATDPAVFTEKYGSSKFVASKHLAKILNIEQLFRRVHAIQTNYRDHNSRKALFLTSLDTLESLLGCDLDRLCDLTYAEETLAEVRDSMTGAAAELLLPAAERAVKALEDLQEGFFLPRQRGEHFVRVPHSTKPDQKPSLQLAAAQYIRVLRNATHGFGGKGLEQEEKGNALLAQHNGYFPYDLPDLAYLYLLAVLCRPTTVRNNLYYRSHH